MLSNKLNPNKSICVTLRTSLVACSLAILTGCVGGTTYGTGVTQEEQTLTDVSEMLTLQKKRKVIDYSARPDLVVPDNKTLVDPVQQASAISDPDWPESPEQRIARIRAAAEEAKATRQTQLAFDRSKKVAGVDNAKLDAGVEAPIGQGVPNYSCDPDGLVMRKCTTDEISRAVQAERKLAKLGSNQKRKYLTDPPTKYLTPATTAVIGDEGFTQAELDEIERQREIERKRRQELDG
ncbi:MAG: hypothetical protein AB8B49_06095 [Nitratireductor sp.]